MAATLGSETTAAAEGNIKGQLTAVVTEVLPNGLLAIRARDFHRVLDNQSSL
jgi:flagellar basal body L-ring protein FlgH